MIGGWSASGMTPTRVVAAHGGGGSLRARDQNKGFPFPLIIVFLNPNEYNTSYYIERRQFGLQIIWKTLDLIYLT